MGLVHNERVKLLATALNNTGLASIVTGVIAPAASFLYSNGMMEPPSPQLIAAGAVWLASGFILMVAGRHTSGGLQE